MCLYNLSEGCSKLHLFGIRPGKDRISAARDVLAFPFFWSVCGGSIKLEGRSREKEQQKEERYTSIYPSIYHAKIIEKCPPYNDL